MSRRKKFVRNVLIIGILLWSMYYFGGYYISKDQCVVETLRGLHGSQGTSVMEIDAGKIDYTIVVNEKEKEVSLVGTKKNGIFYRTASSSVGNEIDENNCIDIFGIAGSEMGMLIAVSRIDESVAKVEAEFDNGDTLIFNEWNGNIAAIHIPGDDWYSGTYRAYDKANNMIGELRY